jgi:hypothetical protein
MSEIIKTLSESAPYAAIGAALATLFAYFQTYVWHKERRHRDEPALRRTGVPELRKQTPNCAERAEFTHRFNFYRKNL